MSNVITLDINTPSIQYLCRKDKRLARVINKVGSISYSLYGDNPYAFLIHEIIEQMLSAKVGQTIYNRLLKQCNMKISPERINNLSDEQIRSIGTSKAKVGYIRNITNAIINKILDLDIICNLTDEEAIKVLTQIKGIGNWTAKMYLIFVLDRKDILPFEDGAFLQVYCWMYKTRECSMKSVKAKCKKWKPYSSVASRFCYRALDMGITKEDFDLIK